MYSITFVTYADLPTAEWAIARLQAEGGCQEGRESGQANAKVTVHGSYTCTSMNHSGRLIVTSEGIQFEPFGASHNQWKVPFIRLNRVEKVSIINLPIKQKRTSYWCGDTNLNRI